MLPRFSSVRKLRPQAQRLLVGRDGLVQGAAQRELVAEVVVALGDVRPERERATEQFDRVGVRAVRREERAVVGEHVGRLGGERECGLELVLRAVAVAGDGEDVGEARVDRRDVRLEDEGAPEPGDRRGAVAAPALGRAEVDERLRELRLDGQGTLIGGDRAGDVAAREERVPAVVLGPPVAGGDGERALVLGERFGAPARGGERIGMPRVRETRPR